MDLHRSRMARRCLLVVLSGLLIALSGCQRSELDMRVIKVSALQNGDVLIDGKPSTLGELNKVLATGDVEVWYYREDPTAETTADQMAIFEVLVQGRAPISLSSKSDF